MTTPPPQAAPATLTAASDHYGADHGASTVHRPLANARAFKGEHARRLKTGLRQHLPNGK